jgi:hypothetical protein
MDDETRSHNHGHGRREAQPRRKARHGRGEAWRGGTRPG